MLSPCTKGHPRALGKTGRIFCPTCRKAHTERYKSLRHPIAIVYRNMIWRCYNKTDARYKSYGARGIKVCDRWLESFDNFVEDMYPSYNPALTLDREDVNGNYEPGNCRWVTTKVQNLNKRSNVSYKINIPEDSPISYLDRVMTLKEFSEITKIPLIVVKSRYALHYNATDWILDPNVDCRYYEYNGIKYNMKELSLITGKPYQKLFCRINEYGWSVYEAVGGSSYKSKPLCEISDTSLDNITLHYQDRDLTLQEISTITNIPLIVLKYRCTLSRNVHWILDNAFKERKYSLNGNNYCLTELSLIGGIDKALIVTRITREKWDVEKATISPPNTTKRCRRKRK